MLDSINSNSWIPIGSYGDENPKLSSDILVLCQMLLTGENTLAVLEFRFFTP